MAIRDELSVARALDELVLSSTTLDQLGRMVIERVCTVARSPRCGLMLFDAERDVLRLLPGSYGSDDQGVASAQFHPAGDPTIAGLVFTTNRPHVSERPALDPQTTHPEYVSLFGLRRMLSVPMRAKQRTVGVLHLANKPAAYTPADVDQAQAIASCVGTVLEAGRTLTAFRRGQRLERILGDLALRVVSGEPIREPLVLAFDALSDEIRSDYTLLRFHTGSEPVVRSSRHASLERGKRRRIWRYATEHAAPEAHVVDPTGAGDPGEAFLRQPIRAGRTSIATLCAYRSRAHSFDEVERRAVARCASVAGLALQAERYRNQRAAAARMLERQRIADDLHDHAAQLLFVARLELESALEDSGRDASTARSLKKAVALITRGDRAIRNAVQTRLPTETADVRSRFGMVVQEIEDQFNVPIRYDVSADAARRLDGARAVATVLLRVAREGIVNAVKHAAPAVVSVELTCDAVNVILIVKDDGVGIGSCAQGNREGSSGYGLASLQRSVQSCGGSLRVFRRRGGGTELRATVAL